MHQHLSYWSVIFIMFELPVSKRPLDLMNQSDHGQTEQRRNPCRCSMDPQHGQDQHRISPFPIPPQTLQSLLTMTAVGGVLGPPVEHDLPGQRRGQRLADVGRGVFGQPHLQGRDAAVRLRRHEVAGSALALLFLVVEEGEVGVEEAVAEEVREPHGEQLEEEGQGTFFVFFVFFCFFCESCASVSLSFLFVLSSWASRDLSCFSIKSCDKQKKKFWKKEAYRNCQK